MSFTNYYYELGYNTTLEKMASRKDKDQHYDSDRILATILGMFPGLGGTALSAIAASKGRTGATAGGQFLGSTAGAGLGMVGGGLLGLAASGDPIDAGAAGLLGMYGGGLAGSTVGGGIGAYLGHGGEKD